MEIAHPAALGDLGAALAAIGLAGPLPALVVVGGATGLGEAAAHRLRGAFVEAVAPAAEALGAAVIDGGTDAGVMRLNGEAREAIKGRFPLAGVVAAGTILPPHGRGTCAEPAAIEPRHTHLVVVPGERWGDESPWIAAVASALAGPSASGTVLLDGGDTSLEDVACSVAAGRPVLVVAGSGRLADALARAMRGEPAEPRLLRLAASGKLRSVSLDGGARALRAAIEALLTRAGPMG